MKPLTLFATLTSLLLAVPAAANSYHYYTCWCRSPFRIGVIREFTYYSERLQKAYTWNSTCTETFMRDDIPRAGISNFCLNSEEPDCAPSDDGHDLCFKKGMFYLDGKHHQKEFDSYHKTYGTLEEQWDECEGWCAELFYEGSVFGSGPALESYCSNTVADWVYKCGSVEYWDLKDI